MKSQRIAVAGGTGGIGQHVVDGLLEVKDKYSLHVIVLSRSSHPDISFAGSSAPVIAVDYNDAVTLEKVLNEHRIDTVLLTLWAHDIKVFTTAQENLLTAALNASTVHRFSPSEYAHDSQSIVDTVSFVRCKLEILEPLRKVKSSRGDKFEYTAFHNGAFMNYLGVGSPKPDGVKALGHLAPFPFVFDFKNRKADIPGEGQRRMVFTAAEDVGKFGLCRILPKYGGTIQSCWASFTVIPMVAWHGISASFDNYYYIKGGAIEAKTSVPTLGPDLNIPTVIAPLAPLPVMLASMSTTPLLPEKGIVMI